jgi:hypothetical protein
MTLKYRGIPYAIDSDRGWSGNDARSDMCGSMFSGLVLTYRGSFYFQIRAERQADYDPDRRCIDQTFGYRGARYRYI